MQVVILTDDKYGVLGVFSTRGGVAAQRARVWVYLRECFAAHPAMRNARVSRIDSVLRKIGLSVDTVDVTV